MRYRFYGLELDTDLRVLRRAGEPVPLQPKVFELIEFLVLHRDRVVPKAVLMRDLWPNAIVTDASLTRLVKEARRALGDDGRRQCVIQTAPRFGYRFCAGVRLSNGAGRNEAQRAIELARRSLEASLDVGARDLRDRVADFAQTCLRIVEGSRGEARG